ncbi:WhiB family transcriptional regulator [Kitasatospora sp. NPDC057223]|uniref:WhiB family transcriptional regulator n=1 Tax=Kitasatospora sp. NPDC057223 TaxID=3346055 RepID=UPI003634E445
MPQALPARRVACPRPGGRGGRGGAGDAPFVVPTLETWAWQSVAACRGMDSSVFFAPPDERSEAKHSREAAARRVCARCPVREACADFALRSHETYGVWGGLTEKERARGRR